MTEFARGHQFHDGVNSLVERAGGDLAGHHLRDLLLHGGGATLGNRTDNVALGKNSDHAGVRSQYYHRSDAAFGEKFRRPIERHTRLYRDNVTALSFNNRFDDHSN